MIRRSTPKVTLCFAYVYRTFLKLIKLVKDSNPYLIDRHAMFETIVFDIGQCQFQVTMEVV